jgi:hypothetical protein
MIFVVVNRAPSGHIISFDVSGHSGYSEAGKDIVCAAVSAIVQTAILGLTDVLRVDIVYQQKAGQVRCVIPERLSQGQAEKVNIILETMLCGLKSIQAGYGKYVRVEERRLE